MAFSSYIRKSYHRNLIENLLKKYKYLIKGKILEIGSKSRRYDHLFKEKIIATDLNPVPELNIIKADLTNLQFQSNNFDSVLCVEVFAYLELENFKKGFEEILRILKKGGKAIITFPFYSKDHQDNLRLSYNYLLKCLNQLKDCKFKTIMIGNRYTALYDMIRFSRNPRLRIYRNLGTKIVLFVLFLIIKSFSLENVRDSFYAGHFIILYKE